MKQKEMPRWLKFILSLVVSCVVGLVGSILVPHLQKPMVALVARLVRDPLYEPMTLYIFLALVPLLVSLVSGYLMALAFRPKVGR